MSKGRMGVKKALDIQGDCAQRMRGSLLMCGCVHGIAIALNSHPRTDRASIARTGMPCVICWAKATKIPAGYAERRDDGRYLDQLALIVQLPSFLPGSPTKGFDSIRQHDMCRFFGYSLIVHFAIPGYASKGTQQQRRHSLRMDQNPSWVVSL